VAKPRGELADRVPARLAQFRSFALAKLRGK